MSASYTPATTAVKASTSAAKTVKVAKGAATITTNKVATTHSTKGAALTVKVAVAKSTATGTITVKEGTKTLVAKKALKSGKLSVTLPKLKVGTHKLTVKYSGSSIWKTAAKSVSVKIVK
nr:Ig-like domain repeat protein [Frondihabitans sp. VKM Ac-2883]